MFIWKKYADYLKTEEKSCNTVEKYVRDAARFVSWVDGDEITKSLVVEYKEHLCSGEYCCKSVNSMLASVNSYLEFVGKSDCKVKALKLQKEIFASEEKELTRAEYFKLLTACNNKRLEMIIQTICSTGIRVGELEYITAESVKRGEALVCCKGKTRRVFIVKPLRKKLLKYISENKIKSGAVFVTRNGKPINRTNIWREMKNLCKKAGVNPSKVFPHNLRHLFARTFYEQEKDIAKLADILGHSNINTTRIYIMTTTTEHRQRLEKMRLII